MKEKVTQGYDLAIALAETLAERKGERIHILDLRGLSDIADWFVIANAQGPRHLRTLGRDLYEEIKEAHIGRCHAEGLESESWIILDLFDVVVHIFVPEKRDFYALDDYWADAPAEVFDTSEVETDNG